MIDFDPKISYLEYVKANRVEIAEAQAARLGQILDRCRWEQPETALEWNNLAVAALVAAEGCDNSLAHGLYAEIAFDAIHAGVELDRHPLCAAHLALLNSMLGNYSEAAEIAFNAFIKNLQPTFTEAEIEPGIIYIPPLTRTHITNGRSEQLQRILNTDNGCEQAMLMLSEVLCRTQISLDNPTGTRLLHLMNQLMPDLIFPNIRLGIYTIGNRELEGLLYLHRAGELALDSATTVQSLSLAYRDLEQPETARYWYQIGADYSSQMSAKIPWQWTTLAIDSPWTYIPFDARVGAVDEREIALAVPASLTSLTTRCLLAQGDWFERELEFWRQYIQPETIAIDVGAGVGVYTFSAALRVGNEGIVYAIEPSAEAIDCLAETCRFNHIENVNIIRAAASNRDGISSLVIGASTEFNHLISATGIDESEPEIVEVTCTKIDTLVETAQLDRVDVIKISTEGHELAILKGCARTIDRFAPTIVYNSYTVARGIDLEAAQYLIDRGYELYRYQPYLQQLIPLESEADFTEVLKAIAIKKKVEG